jgi:hypothetical protein
MSLWARFKAWWEAVKAEERALCAKEHARGVSRQRTRSDATFVGAATLGAHGAHMGGHYESGGAYGPSGTDCGPGVSGDCSGTGV